MTESTVDTLCDSIDYTNADEVISVLFPELFAFVSDLESELDASMGKMFRLNSHCYCPKAVAIPLACHLSLCDNVRCMPTFPPLRTCQLLDNPTKLNKS
jgi:hypothetical protein